MKLLPYTCIVNNRFCAIKSIITLMALEIGVI